MDRGGEALLRAVCEEPRDDDLRLIYADWLDDHGQPDRAAFIRFQCRYPDGLFGHPDYQHLLDEDRRFDPLKPAWEALAPRPRGVKWWPGWFRRGFLAGVQFMSARAFGEHAEAVFNASPLELVLVRRVTNRTVRTVLASPLLGRLRKLHLNGVLGDAGVGLVAACPYLARLETLAIWGGGFGDFAAEALAGSPYLRGLRALSFCTHTIGDRGALALAESACLAGVTDLVLHGTRGLSEPVIDRLNARFPRLV